MLPGSTADIVHGKDGNGGSYNIMGNGDVGCWGGAGDEIFQAIQHSNTIVWIL